MNLFARKGPELGVDTLCINLWPVNGLVVLQLLYRPRVFRRCGVGPTEAVEDWEAHGCDGAGNCVIPGLGIDGTGNRRAFGG